MSTSDATLIKTFFSLLVILFLLSSKNFMSVSAGEATCDVFVSRYGEAFTYVPQGSTIYIDCAGESGQSPVWSVRLTETATNLHTFGNPASANLLNSRGFYEINLPSNGSEQNVVQLLVNSTAHQNNRTLVRCADAATAESPTLFETTLVIYEPSAIIPSSHDVGVRSINISWSPPLEVNQTYFLTVKSHIMFNESFELNQPYYNFNAPTDAPPCEVYYFSISATYVGATYTGAGCNVPGPVLSRTLPSLPVITELEASIVYSIKKLDGIVSVTVNFQPAVNCEDYPADNYTLVVNSSMFESDLQESVSVPQDGDKEMIEMSIDLAENNVFTVKVLATNSFGTATTKEMTIYTTDVQRVTAEISSRDFANGDAVVTVQCDFIANSDAQGCMVVLVGEFNNITVNVTRDTTGTCVVLVNVLNETFHKIFGFDIESGGSVSSTAVPGVVVENDNDFLTCNPEVTTSTASNSGILVIALAPSASFLVLILLLAILIVAVILLRSKVKTKRSLTVIAPAVNRLSQIAESTGRDPEENETKFYQSAITEPNQQNSDENHIYQVLEESIRCAPKETHNIEADGMGGHEEQQNVYHTLEDQDGTQCVTEAQYSELSPVYSELEPHTSQSNKKPTFRYPTTYDASQQEGGQSHLYHDIFDL